MKLLVTGAFQMNDAERAELEAAGYEVFFQQQERERTISPEQYEAVICNALFQFNPIERFSSLRLIQLTSAGLDRVPLKFIREHGIALHNAAGVYSVPMAEFAIGGILQLYKGSRQFMESQRAHSWQKRRGLLELCGNTVCIVGTGDVGRETAKRLNAFGCCVIGVNRTVRSLPEFDEVLPLSELKTAAGRADVLLCCVALTDETRGLIDGKIFDALPDHAVFVNIARGGLVNEQALIAWLCSGRSLGAVLDVFETEPLPDNSPLWDMEKVILTPHNSFSGEGNHERLFQVIKVSLV